MTVPEAFALALQHHQAGRLAEAETLYRQILAVAPHASGCHANLGLALASAGRLPEAIATYRRALALEPDFAEVHYNLGNALAEQGDPDSAIAAYRRAVELKPLYAEAHNNLGNALLGQNCLDEAVASFHRALHLRPDFAEAHYNLGNALRERGLLDAAIAAFRRALELKPDYAVAQNNLGNALKNQGRLEEAIAAYRLAVKLQPDYAGARSNLILAAHYHPESTAAALREECAQWEEQHAAARRPFIRPHANDPQPERQLKVGYVSPDFRSSAVANFLLPLLEAHDPEAVAVHCYASVARPDEVTGRMKSCANVWRDVGGERDEALTECVRADRIDILVDLSLHSAHHRLLAFAEKPAPVQVAWLGHPGTTGLRTMDCRLTDAQLEPEGAAWSESVERAVRLPDSWFCFDPVEEFPDPGELPALRAGRVTFGCLNPFCKINDPVLRRWAGVLAAVDGSRLLLRCPEGEARERVRGLFHALGITATRVDFAPSLLPRDEYLRIFRQLDLALDPAPYNGGTTTCESLWMGVPVLTLPGEVVASRLGLSILSAAGMPEFIADSEADYVRLAAELAGDLPRLAQLRATLRERMQASAFMDAPRFARNVESAFRQMWRAWCAAQPLPAR